MKSVFSKGEAALGVAAIASQAIGQAQSSAKGPEELIKALRDTNRTTSASACEAAPEYGAGAIRPLAMAMADSNFEVARRGKRALAKIVHRAGRPGAKAEAQALEAELVPLVSKTEMVPVQVRRDLMWMLSEIGSYKAVPPIAALLTHQELREDARCVLIRMPFPQATKALKAAFRDAPEEFKFALADALRARGEKVEGYASKKLIPITKTSVTPLTEKK